MRLRNIHSSSSIRQNRKKGHLEGGEQLNAVGMMFQQVTKTGNTFQQNRAESAGTDETMDFENLLANAGISTDNQKDGQEKMSPENMLRGLDGLNQLMDSSIAKEELLQTLNEIMNSFVMDRSGAPVAGQNDKASKEAIVNLLKTAIGKLELEHGSKTEEENMSAPFLVTMPPSPGWLNNEPLQKQFDAIFAKAERLLSQITGQKSIAKAAPELLKLLEQWTVLERKSSGPFNMVTSSVHTNKEQTTWRELVHAFQKRNQLVTKQQYNSSAKVTSTDVAKWLQHALNNQGSVEKASSQPSSMFTTSAPLTKAEQYVIHMNQTQNTRPAGQQLMEQFQKVMKTSKFLAMNNGTSQLNITLRPENLGDMMVKFTQMNGEMTVKIVVTSTAVKEMLESNMHQLKHMFSPQQVVIEKQEAATQTQTYQRGQGEQSMDNHDDQEQSGHSKQHDGHQDEDEESFESYLQRTFMNEEV